MQYLAEGFGALAVLLNFIGYRQNHVNRYLIVSACALLSVSIHFFMLGAMAAGVGCMLASIRNIFTLRYRSRALLSVFILLNLLFLAYEWFYLDHGPLIFVAYASSLIFTVGSISLEDTTKIRKWFILAESLGLTYSLCVGSVFGAIFNISNLTSIVVKLCQQKQAKELE
ncbi:YgjV family protein [Alteromonas pelagimontana]|uniref:YgjV family protein n=1 Tax=Alteromonas pelagimontana TaxID=1858656 RepID=A0A6M4MEH1_9ALTE|nr:YgjV family protein [Alteromonas pelagimontana]QJR81591.1 YgjV family protein [Alteromonas pelagimontana]